MSLYRPLSHCHAWCHIVCCFQTTVPTVPHNLTVHTVPGLVGGEVLLGKESPGGSSHSSTGGSGSGPYQVLTLFIVITC